MSIFYIILIVILLLGLVMTFVRGRKISLELSDMVSSNKRTIRELNIINELTAALLSSLEMESVIELLLDRAKELLRATRSAVILIEPGGRVREFHTSLGPAPDCKIKLTGTLLKVFEDMTPLRATNVTETDDFKRFPDQHPDIRSILAVPIILRSKVIGELIVTDKLQGDSFTPADEDLLLTMAFHSAFAIEKVLLHTEVLKMATTDGLTGLHNHRSFQERLENEIERVRRYDHSFSLMILDIDRFKDFNDAYGHQAGDIALRSIAGVMNDNIRGADMAARYGGEEFAIILSETPLDGAIQTAERIRGQIEKLAIQHDGQTRRVTISIGIAEFPSDGLSREELIESADKALYYSKRSGRNKVSTFS
ncbi:MAG: sensor domain-containing diguanylate cyclase [Nitrospirota bacterium]|nr:MAG: sensor domain-containing diguanylate cyclase [Nitrospirota bacterium]